MTPLDRAHARMDAAPEDEGARLAYFRHLADTELFLLLESEPEGQDIAPDLYSVEDGSFALAFDLPERLADFVGRPAPYAALPGRVLAAMLAGHEIGLALNPGQGLGEMLLAAEGVDWLAEMLAQAPQSREGRPTRLSAPTALPDGLFEILDERLAAAAGLARTAWLCAADWPEGGQGLVLAIVDADPAARDALAKDIAEALAFSGLGSGWLDVMFLTQAEAAEIGAEAVGLGFVLPVPQAAAAPAVPTPPGMDPDRPPKLR